MKITHFGKVEHTGYLKISNRKAFDTALLDFKNKEVVITIETKGKRSLNQNSYFHGVLLPIVKEHLLDLGWKEARSLEWVKNYIKFNCLIKEVVNEKTGEITKTLGETSGLTKGEFNDFIADVQQWSMEKLGLYLPDPNEQMKIKY
jgi:hypothetical protein